MNNLSVFNSVNLQMLKNLGLTDYEIIQPKQKLFDLLKDSMKLIAELPEELSVLKNIFQEELQEVIWLRPKENICELASAAYPEVPGKVFVGTGVFYYVPPYATFQKFSKYAAFENMLHECLHHRGEKLILANDRLKSLLYSQIEINIPWRNTKWSFSHSLQAYYIYHWVLRIRNWAILTDILNENEKNQLKDSLSEVENIINLLRGQLCQVAGINQNNLSRALSLI